MENGRRRARARRRSRKTLELPNNLNTMYYLDVNKVRIRGLGALRDVVFLFSMNRYMNI